MAKKAKDSEQGRAGRKSRNGNRGELGFETDLFKAADKLRGNMEQKFASTAMCSTPGATWAQPSRTTTASRLQKKCSACPPCWPSNLPKATGWKRKSGKIWRVWGMNFDFHQEASA